MVATAHRACGETDGVKGEAANDMYVYPVVGEERERVEGLASPYLMVGMHRGWEHRFSDCVGIARFVFYR